MQSKGAQSFVKQNRPYEQVYTDGGRFIPDAVNIFDDQDKR